LTSTALLQVDYGNITDRLELRKRLNCRSFRWYLENVYAFSPVPVTFHSIGKVIHKRKNACLDTMATKTTLAHAGVTICDKMGGFQSWTFTGLGELRHDEMCLNTSRTKVLLTTCDADREDIRWEYDDKVSKIVKYF
jgi:polypeptide N-acetylgalactosaminyltransferase